MLLKKDYEGGLLATLIYDQEQMRNYDLRNHLPGLFVSISNPTVPLRRLFQQHRSNPVMLKQANVVRFAPNSGRRADIPDGRLCQEET